ncbi:hypothetical protein COOONC_18332 [Cooperia oncophora]
MRLFDGVLLVIAVLLLSEHFGAYAASAHRLCGLCKVCTEIARFALSHNIISNVSVLFNKKQFLIVPSPALLFNSPIKHMSCRSRSIGRNYCFSILHSLTLKEICQLEHMCSVSTSGFGHNNVNFSHLVHSYDVDAINIMLSRVDSVENFTDLTVGVRPGVERFVANLADFFPLLKDLRMREDQRDTLVVLTNRFLKALTTTTREPASGKGVSTHNT